MSVMNGKGLALGLVAVWGVALWGLADGAGTVRVAYALGRMADPLAWVVLAVVWVVLMGLVRLASRSIN